MPLSYPVHLGVAYIFLAGYLFRTVFVSLRLPASVGVLISGFVFAQFFQDDLFKARGSLQEIAFFTVLLEAGLDLTLEDLQPSIFVLAWLPWTCELLAVAAYGVFVLDFTKREAFVLGTILSTLGPGLVMPKMKEFGAQCQRHPLPRLVFTWAPLEGSVALIFFGFMLGLVSPDQPVAADRHIGTLMLANILRIVATVGVGALLGCVSGWLISRRVDLRARGQPFFTNTAVETFLLTLAAALIAYSLGASRHGHIFMPLPFGIAPGSLFQSEPLVVAFATTFALAADRCIVQEVKSILGGVWVFGQLILFSMIGCGADLSILNKARSVLPLLGLGLLVRLLAVLAAVFGTRRSRGCELQSPWSTAKDAAFCFLATLPRATLQAVLGAVPVTQRFFHNDRNRHEAEMFIFTAARVYIVVMSVVGQTLLNTFGPPLLRSTVDRPEEEFCKGVPQAGAVLLLPGTADKTGTTEQMTDAAPSSSAPVSPTAIAEEQLSAIGQLAEEYGLDRRVLKTLLQEEADDQVEPEQKLPVLPQALRKVVALGVGSRMQRRIRKTVSDEDLVLSQFDSMGSVYNSGGRSSW